DPVPAGLAAEPAGFVNREPELRLLDGLLEQRSGGRAGFGVISGASGTGKSGLALRWAHRVKDRFPDGQVHVDLGSGKRSLADAAQQVLHELGFTGADVPEEPR